MTNKDNDYVSICDINVGDCFLFRDSPYLDDFRKNDVFVLGSRSANLVFKSCWRAPGISKNLWLSTANSRPILCLRTGQISRVWIGDGTIWVKKVQNPFQPIDFSEFINAIEQVSKFGIHQAA